MIAISGALTTGQGSFDHRSSSSSSSWASNSAGASVRLPSTSPDTRREEHRPRFYSVVIWGQQFYDEPGFHFVTT